jgi:hypothetical protein
MEARMEIAAQAVDTGYTVMEMEQEEDIARTANSNAERNRHLSSPAVDVAKQRLCSTLKRRNADAERDERWAGHGLTSEDRKERIKRVSQVSVHNFSQLHGAGRG